PGALAELQRYAHIAGRGRPCPLEPLRQLGAPQIHQEALPHQRRSGSTWLTASQAALPMPRRPPAAQSAPPVAAAAATRPAHAVTRSTLCRVRGPCLVLHVPLPSVRGAALRTPAPSSRWPARVDRTDPAASARTGWRGE